MVRSRLYADVNQSGRRHRLWITRTEQYRTGPGLPTIPIPSITTNTPVVRIICPASSSATIAKTDQANHQYVFQDFWTAAKAGNMPAIGFLRGSEVTDGHPGYSDPLLEQAYLVKVLNHIQQLPQWRNTAVFITWDDLDGWL